MLFTSKNCVHCPVAKEYLKEHNINFIEIDVYSDDFKYLQKDLLHNGIILKYVPALVWKEGNKMKLVNRNEILGEVEWLK